MVSNVINATTAVRDLAAYPITKDTFAPFGELIAEMPPWQRGF